MHNNPNEMNLYTLGVGEIFQRDVQQKLTYMYILLSYNCENITENLEHITQFINYCLTEFDLLDILIW